MLSALILAGGLGTRLAKTVPNLPKALAPIQGKPFLELLLQQIESSKIFTKIILALGYRSTQIIDFLNQRKGGIPIEISLETAPLGTGGAIVHALKQIESRDFLTMNGDSFFDISLASFFKFHQEKQASLSIACIKTDSAKRFGSLVVDSEKKILQFSEKTGVGNGWINAGVYFMQKNLFDGLPAKSYSIEKDLFPVFLSQRVFAYPAQSTFIDIGTHESYYEAQKTLKPWISL